MKKTIVSICSIPDDPSSCPLVTISDNKVTIGEKDNLVILKTSQWNKIVDLIKSGKLKKV